MLDLCLLSFQRLAYKHLFVIEDPIYLLSDKLVMKHVRHLIVTMYTLLLQLTFC